MARFSASLIESFAGRSLPLEDSGYRFYLGNARFLRIFRPSAFLLRISLEPYVFRYEALSCLIHVIDT